MSKIEKIEKLSEILKKEVEKKELTIKEAQMIADSFEDLEQQKVAIKAIKGEKKEHEKTMKYISDVITGKEKAPVKVYKSGDQRIVEQFERICKQIAFKMTVNNIKGYSDQTQPILMRIMKQCFEHFQNELKTKKVIVI